MVLSPAAKAGLSISGLLLAMLAGIAFLCVPYVTSVQDILHGRNDFAALYGSARLVGTPHLYDRAEMMRIKAEAAGEWSPARQYIRLPYVAALLWPLGRMSYPAAYRTFQCISLAALAAFILLWPGSRIPLLLACCWSLPVSAVLAQGQDVFFPVLWITLALRFVDRRPLVAGLFLALCASKFHLFLTIPILLAARRLGRTAAGMALGGALLGLASFVVAGADWPVRYLNTISSPAVSPNLEVMPNLHNLLSGLPGRTALELALALACAAAVWVVSRAAGFSVGLAVSLIAGLLTGVHTYPQDCAFLIPAAFLLIGTGVWWLRLAGACLLLPVWHLLLLLGPGVSRLVPAFLLALLAAVTWEAARSGCKASAGQPLPADGTMR